MMDDTTLWDLYLSTGESDVDEVRVLDESTYNGVYESLMDAVAYYGEDRIVDRTERDGGTLTVTLYPLEDPMEERRFRAAAYHY